MGAADIAAALFTVPEQTRPIRNGRTAPLRALGRPRLDAALAPLYLTGNAGDDARPGEESRQLGSKTPGHPENFETWRRDHHRPARRHRDRGRHGMAEKMLAAEFSKKVVNHHTYVLASDGDLMEGLAGSDRDGRPLAAQQADRAVRRQRHFHRRRCRSPTRRR
jgi:transketolase